MWQAADCRKGANWTDVLSAQHAAEVDAAAPGVLQHSSVKMQVAQSMRHGRERMCLCHIVKWMLPCLVWFEYPVSRVS